MWIPQIQAKDTWVVVVGKELSCNREPTNREDRFAVAVTKDFSCLEVTIQSIHRDSGLDIHLHTMAPMNNCRSRVDNVCNCDPIGFQL